MRNQAFGGDEAAKARIVADLKARRESGRIIPGIVGNEANGESCGCAVFSIAGSYNHVHAAEILGVHPALIYAMETIFEKWHGALWNKSRGGRRGGRRVDLSGPLEFPERLVRAIKPGADLEPVIGRMVAEILGENSPFHPGVVEGRVLADLAASFGTEGFNAAMAKAREWAGVHNRHHGVWSIIRDLGTRQSGPFILYYLLYSGAAASQYFDSRFDQAECWEALAQMLIDTVGAA